MHPSLRRSENLMKLLKMMAKGATYPELENHLRKKGLSDPTIRSYINAIKAIGKDPTIVKRILKNIIH